MKMSKRVETALKNAFSVELTESELNEYCQTLLVLSLGTVRKMNGDQFAREFVETGMAQKVDIRVEPSPSSKTKH